MFISMFIYQNTTGCITWLYCAEIAVDISLGIACFIGYFVIFCLTISTTPMINSNLHESGTFFIFGAVCLVCVVWCYFIIEETSGGLTDVEKKSVYVP
jgi:hypothetical protein